MAGKRASRGGYRIVPVLICILGLMSSAAPARAAPSGSEAAGTPGPNSAHILSDGQFVYGPNVGDFNLSTYLQDNAPQLAGYADALYGRAEYYSINPKIYVTLLEMQSQLVSHPTAMRMQNPLGLNSGDFLSQIDRVSEAMLNAYYLHLNEYSSVPSAARALPALRSRSGEMIEVAPAANAGTYAITAALASVEEAAAVGAALDPSLPASFYQTYRRLFADDPLSEQNHIYVQGQAGYLSAPPDLLQLPYTRGESWMFGGVHNNGGGDSTTGFTDGSAIDFMPGSVSWGADTSNMWVVAASAGAPTKISDCYFDISRADGWETTYYHLENIQSYSGWINQNDRIGVIANTEAEAICSGGASTGPHVHFALKRNGAFVAINGTALSGWFVHAGRWPYDTDPGYMWLERSGVKRYAWQPLLSEGISAAGSGTYDDPDAGFSYSGAWLSAAVPGAYGDTLHIGLAAGAAASFTFSGSGFNLSYLRYTGLGSMAAYLDGGTTPLATLNGDGAVALATYNSPVLSAGVHTVTFKHAGPAGTYVAIDSLEVRGSAFVGAGTYDFADAAFSYTGAWVPFSVTGLYGDTLHISTSTGSTATLAFNGTGFSLSYVRYAGTGDIELYVDDSPAPYATINTNGPTALLSYEAVLPAGDHSLKLMHAGSAGSLIAVDSITITP